jgi:hypothetical protein
VHPIGRLKPAGSAGDAHSSYVDSRLEVVVPSQELKTVEREFGGLRLIDAIFPIKAIIGGMASALGLPLLALLLVSSVLLLPLPWDRLGPVGEIRFGATMTIGIMLGTLLFVIRHTRNQKRWERVVPEIVWGFRERPRAIATLLQDIYKGERTAGAASPTLPVHGRRIAKVLQAANVTGVAIRLSTEPRDVDDPQRLDKSGQFELNPFPFAFEPTMFKHAKTLFEQHEHEKGGTVTNKPRRRRLWLLAAVVAGASLTMFGLLSSIWAIVGSAFLATLAVAAGFASIHVAADAVAAHPTRRTDQFFLVPGGLVERRRSVLKTQEAPLLYSRHDASLIVLHNRNEILLTRPEGEPKSIPCNSQEQLAVLNAWLCPATPPSPEQLSDLAGADRSAAAHVPALHQVHVDGAQRG